MEFFLTEQRLNNKFSFTQYDDLGRVTISGEAAVDTLTDDYRNVPEWLIDELEPNQLNYEGSGVYPVTINPTLWLLPDRDTPRFWTPDPDSLAEIWQGYFDYIDGVSNICSNQTYLMHPANYYWSYYNWQNTVLSGLNNFEDVSEYPEFVKVVNHYDELPEKAGAVWGNFPTTDEWNSLLVNNPWETGYKELRNLKGRTAAVAYRDNGKEPFHYIIYSYDPRGRVQAMLKYNENLGFEAVYYKYNSANKVIQQRVFDASRQFSTWYSYDDNGRVDSVWTSKEENGFDVYYPYNIPSCPAKPEQADIAYSYDERGNISNTKFLPANVNQTTYFSKRGWADSIVARNGENFNTLYFKQELTRDYVGNITKQVSMQLNQNSLIQNYEYDGLYRLTHWDANGNDDVDFTYDIMGNRITENRNNEYFYYNYYNSISSNRLADFYGNSSNTIAFSYFYNGIGAVDSIEKYDIIDNDLYVKSLEKFYYNSEGRAKRYKKYNLGDENLGHCAYRENEDKAMSPDKRTVWQYRYSPLGAREQKRLLYSPQGDAICTYYNSSWQEVTEKNHHTWEYYMLGAAGEQLAVYNGVQVKFDKADNETERFVYMYLHSFISAGGQLVTLANGTKQFNIVDNLGSVRCIVSWDGTAVSTQAFDYKPFGDLQEAGEENRIGYFGEQRDKESDYFAMGFRLYDPEIGRFLAIDPLLDVQPSQTPYHYCFNNPTSFTDPTGLYPEKEKGDKVQMWVCDDWDLQNSFRMMMEDQAEYYEACDEFRRWSTSKFSDYCYKLYLIYKFYNGGGGGGRTGASGDAVNGFFLGPEQRAAIQNNIRVEAGEGVDNPDQAVQSFWNKFWTANQYMTQENYEYYTNHNIVVRLVSNNEFENYSNNEGKPSAIGWHLGENGISTITFAANIFSDSYTGGFGYYTYNIYSPKQRYNLLMVMMHEFGHGFGYYKLGEYYNSMYDGYRENWAIWFMNTNYNSHSGFLPEMDYFMGHRWAEQRIGGYIGGILDFLRDIRILKSGFNP